MLIADFHIHSRYSRACSKNLTLPNIAAACERKGINLVTVSDFTHPEWLAHIEEELEECASGIFCLRGGRSATRFILTTELSCIYSQGGKVRRIHLIVFAPSLVAVKKLIAELERRECNVRSDGRPILGLPAKEILRLCLEISPQMFVVPAHAWTPWFSVFGSKSGFDSLEECFEELAPHVSAIETGLSSDPPMNWRLSALDKITLISNSDAHSLEKLGREATVFNLDPASTYTYDEIIAILRNKNSGGLKETIEFFPEEGKYHIDGHADCKFSCAPEETKKLDGKCPRCGKNITVGVLARVVDLADRNEEDVKVIHSLGSYRKIIPLAELVAHTLGVGPQSKKVVALYDKILAAVGNEFYVLLDVPLEKIRAVDGEVAHAISAMRAQKIALLSGYDGVFGKIDIITAARSEQKNLL